MSKIVDAIICANDFLTHPFLVLIDKEAYNNHIMCDTCIKWTQKELDEITSRILRLSDKQIIDLFEKVDISYKNPMTQVLAEMRESKVSLPMDVLTSEASSKEDLLRWISVFEKQNQQQ